jgi:hypothetical protein
MKKKMSKIQLKNGKTKRRFFLIESPEKRREEEKTERAKR